MNLTRAPRASVVIPIYNVEEYLEECIDSVVHQTIFDDLEVILVDDGSTDSSGEIALRYATCFENVKLVEKVNGGLGSARNAGIRAATAPLITFLDSDDTVPEDAYQRMTEFMEANTDADVVAGQMRTFPAKTNFYWQSAFSGPDRVISSVAELPTLIHSASACNKLFRVEAWKRVAGFFPEGVHFEDAPVVVPFLLTAKKIGVISDLVYNYRKRDAGGSIMDSLFTREKNYWDYLSMLETIAASAANMDVAKRLVAYEFCVRGFQGFLMRAPEVLSGDDLETFYNRAWAIFRDCPVETMIRHSHNGKHRFAFGAFVYTARNGSEWSDPTGRWKMGMRFERPYLGPTDAGDLESLFVGDAFVASLEGFALVGNNVVLQGRINAKGLPFVRRPDFQIQIGLGRRRFEARWVERIDRAKLDGKWSAWEASIPVEQWPYGEYLPRLHMTGARGAASPRIFSTAAYFRNAGTLRTPNCSWILSENERHHAVIRRLRVSRSSLRRLVTSVRDVAKKKPLAKWVLLARLARVLRLDNIWLVGERFDNAQDNAAFLFRKFGRQRIRGMKMTYVIDKNAAAYTEISKYGTVVAHGSLRHKLALIRARVLLSAFDTDSYLIPREWNRGKFISSYVSQIRPVRAFLQHGVTFSGDGVVGLHRLSSGYDLVATSGVDETKFFADELGYGAAAVQSGMPRFDGLSRIHGSSGPIILFAPTWRPGLVVPSYRSQGTSRALAGFESSLYFRSIMEFLQSDRLRAHLERSGAKMYFLPHHEAAPLFSEALADVANVQVADLSARSFQEWLRAADVFITDYSSTSFDVALMKTPIVYFGWDPVDPASGQFFEASYYLYERDGFGPVAHSSDEVVDALEQIHRDSYQMRPDHARRVDTFFRGVTVGSCSDRFVEALSSIQGAVRE